MKKTLIFLLFCSLTSLISEEAPVTKEIIVENSYDQEMFDEKISYKVVFGNLVLKSDDGKEKASVYYTAYFKKGEDSKKRPLTFCFNGGPGAGSVWLNIGGIGPKCLPASDLEYQNPPYSLVDNPHSFLYSSDLVFVDPVSTGLSQEAAGVDVKNLHKIDEDVKMMSDFIRLFTLKNKRFDSPKYLMGESYGAMRAAKVGFLLHDTYGYYLNGLILISPFLDFTTVFQEGLNDLPFVLFLPTMTAVSKYHSLLDGDRKLEEVLNESIRFSEGDYSLALLKGDDLKKEERSLIIDKLSKLTGIKPSVFESEDLRLNPSQYRKIALESKGLILGRFDGRVSGIDSKAHPFVAPFDPSLEAVFGAMTASYNQFLAKDLKWPENKEYQVLVSLPNWNWKKEVESPSAVPDLQKLMSQNPKIKVFVATGLYDLAVPFRATEYALSHLYLPLVKERIYQHRFEAGHMMYLSPEIRKDLGFQLKEFINSN